MKKYPSEIRPGDQIGNKTVDYVLGNLIVMTDGSSVTVPIDEKVEVHR